jgi:hypothetical protein
MGRYLRWCLVGGAVGMLAATFAYPVFQAWIREFQGLITGLAAVFAAAITIGKMDATIRTMERTDDAAQRRHEQAQRQSRTVEGNSERRHLQLLNLSLRSARLTVSRSVFPMVEFIEDALEDIEGWRHRLIAEDGGWTISENMTDFDKMAGSWHAIVNNKQLTIAENYYDGDMVYALDRSREALDKIFKLLSDLSMKRTTLKWYADDQNAVETLLGEPAKELGSELGTLQEYLTKFSGGLRKLERDYLRES